MLRPSGATRILVGAPSWYQRPSRPAAEPLSVAPSDRLVAEWNAGGDLTRDCPVDVEALNWPAHPASVAGIKNGEIAAAAFALQCFAIPCKYSSGVMLIMFIRPVFIPHPDRALHQLLSRNPQYSHPLRDFPVVRIRRPFPTRF